MQSLLPRPQSYDHRPVIHKAVAGRHTDRCCMPKGGRKKCYANARLLQALGSILVAAELATIGRRCVTSDQSSRAQHWLVCSSSRLPLFTMNILRQKRKFLFSDSLVLHCRAGRVGYPLSTDFLEKTCICIRNQGWWQRCQDQPVTLKLNGHGPSSLWLTGAAVIALYFRTSMHSVPVFDCSTATEPTS